MCDEKRTMIKRRGRVGSATNDIHSRLSPLAQEAYEQIFGKVFSRILLQVACRLYMVEMDAELKSSEIKEITKLVPLACCYINRKLIK